MESPPELRMRDGEVSSPEERTKQGDLAVRARRGNRRKKRMQPRGGSLRMCCTKQRNKTGGKQA